MWRRSSKMLHHTRLDCDRGQRGSMRRGVAEAVHHARATVRAFGALLAEAAHAATCSPTWPWSPRPRCGRPFALRAPTTRTTGRCGASVPRCSSTGSASARRRTSRRRSSASAATATWRSRRCRSSSATRRSTASGRDRERHVARRAPRARARAGRPPRLPGRVRAGAGGDARLDAALDALRGAVAEVDGPEGAWSGRRAVEDARRSPSRPRLLVRTAPPSVADAFCAGPPGRRRRAYGTLPAGVDGEAIVARALAA